MLRLVIAFVLLLAPRAALACPVCFGQNDSPLASAINLGVIAMLVVVGGVLTGFAAFIVHLVRRARLAPADPASDSASSFVARSDAQGGTAQC